MTIAIARSVFFAALAVLCAVLIAACGAEYTYPAPTQEVCDLEDNDGDGFIDEDLPVKECDTGLPGLCNPGTTMCQNGQINCTQTIFPSAETCDGKDNDCDGETDEDDWAVGNFCNTGKLGVCITGTYACIDGDRVCQPKKASPETCDSLDNDCDGIVDQGFFQCCTEAEPGVFICYHDAYFFTCDVIKGMPECTAPLYIADDKDCDSEDGLFWCCAWSASGMLFCDYDQVLTCDGIKTWPECTVALPYH